MPEKAERLHLRVAGATDRELGLSRGAQLRGSLAGAYEKYAELFRVVGVSEAKEREAARAAIAVLQEWRPEAVEELAGIAAGSGLELTQVAALNARTEIIALGARASRECSTVTAKIDGHRLGVQTWDWHIELDPFWHTQQVTGPGYRFAGLTEQGIVSKIGVNEAGLALHFNILGHESDGADGVPMHVLSSRVLSECATVREAVELVRSAPIGSSSAFTMLDKSEAVSLEISPVGVFEIPEIDGSVQRTNHFQNDAPLAGQKSEVYEPDSTARLDLVRDRLREGRPRSDDDMVRLLVSGEGDAPLSCVADMSRGYGERWATLATMVTDPVRRSIRILDGMPTEAATGEWREFHA